MRQAWSHSGSSGWLPGQPSASSTAQIARLFITIGKGWECPLHQALLMWSESEI